MFLSDVIDRLDDEFSLLYRPNWREVNREWAPFWYYVRDRTPQNNDPITVDDAYKLASGRIITDDFNGEITPTFAGESRRGAYANVFNEKLNARARLELESADARLEEQRLHSKKTTRYRKRPKKAELLAQIASLQERIEKLEAAHGKT